MSSSIVSSLGQRYRPAVTSPASASQLSVDRKSAHLSRQEAQRDDDIMILARKGDPKLKGKRLVVIGASAGGLGAMKILLGGLTQSFPMPIIFITHLSPKYASYLDEVLDVETRLNVIPSIDGAELKPGFVYVSVPGKNVHVVETGIRVLPRERDEYFCPSINVTFRSAAMVYGAQLIAVLLTGRLDDGAEGLIKVHESNGVTIVQDPRNAEHPSMPLQAMARNEPDFVEQLEDIADRLVELAGH